MGLTELSLTNFRSILARFENQDYVVIFVHLNNDECFKTRNVIEDVLGKPQASPDKGKTEPEGFLIDWETDEQICIGLNQVIQAMGCTIPKDLAPPYIFASESYFDQLQAQIIARCRKLGVAECNCPIIKVSANMNVTTQLILGNETADTLL